MGQTTLVRLKKITSEVKQGSRPPARWLIFLVNASSEAGRAGTKKVMSNEGWVMGEVFHLPPLITHYRLSRIETPFLSRFDISWLIRD